MRGLWAVVVDDGNADDDDDDHDIKKSYDMPLLRMLLCVEVILPL